MLAYDEACCIQLKMLSYQMLNARLWWEMFRRITFACLLLVSWNCANLKWDFLMFLMVLGARGPCWEWVIKTVFKTWINYFRVYLVMKAVRWLFRALTWALRRSECFQPYTRWTATLEVQLATLVSQAISSGLRKTGWKLFLSRIIWINVQQF